MDESACEDIHLKPTVVMGNCAEQVHGHLAVSMSVHKAMTEYLKSSVAHG